MSQYARFLRITAIVFFIVAGSHVVLGLSADILLGARAPVDVVSDPVLDSQNRFFGAVFGIYGVLFFLCAGDLVKYATLLRCTLWCYFAGGVARLISIGLVGVPSPLVLSLLATELLLPAFFALWLNQLEKAK
jgi:hypothetical protein